MNKMFVKNLFYMVKNKKAGIFGMNRILALILIVLVIVFGLVLIMTMSGRVENIKLDVI